MKKPRKLQPALIKVRDQTDSEFLSEEIQFIIVKVLWRISVRYR